MTHTDIIDAINHAQQEANTHGTAYVVTKRLKVMRLTMAKSHGYHIAEVCRPCLSS